MALPEVVVEGVVFSPVARPPGSGNTHFLAGAGVRGLEIEGKFIKFAAIAVYLEDAAAAALSGKWSGKTADELAADPAFFRGGVQGGLQATDVLAAGRVRPLHPLAGRSHHRELLTVHARAFTT
ncbi:hypothetical protein EJB05_33153, partial [Eragrostis curvula]